MVMVKPVVIGITRFSVDPLSVVGENLKSEDDLSRDRQAVYDSQRLLTRLTLFNHFTLPSMIAVAKRHQPFFHLLAHSSTLPASMLAALDDLWDRHRPWLRLVEIAPGENFNTVMREQVRTILAQCLQGGECGFNFRIDDDDALHPDFLDAVINAWPACSPGQVLSFDCGQYLQRISDDQFLVSDIDYPKIAIGLGVFCNSSSSECVFDLPVHHKIPDERILNIRDKDYWVRTLHSHNDSGTRSSAVNPLSFDEATARLSRRYDHLPVTDALRSLPSATETRRVLDASRILFGVQ